MKFPISTGQVAHVLHSTEPTVAELVRRGKITPQPKILAGRRLWEAHQLEQAARELGVELPAEATERSHD